MRTLFLLQRVIRVAAVLSVSAPCATYAGGIPEPSLILYGVVRNVYGSDNLRLTVGQLTWRFQPADGGPVITATTALTNINDQFSYVLRVPCEAPVLGFATSSNALRLTVASLSYNRSQVAVDGNAAFIAQPALGNVSLSTLDRGRIARVDLQTSFVPADKDFNGIPDDWERQYFGLIGVDSFADPDGDGMENWKEYQAGTDPTNEQSLFKIIEIQPDVVPGMVIRWPSIAGKTYIVERSADVLTGFIPIQTNVPATPDLNTFRDTGAIGPGPYFYRLRVQR